jgi:hypothetical protein
MVIDNEYEIGESVYLQTDQDQHPRLVTALLIRKYDIMYELSCGAYTSNHMDYEITKDKQYANL